MNECRRNAPKAALDLVFEFAFAQLNDFGIPSGCSGCCFRTWICADSAHLRRHERWPLENAQSERDKNFHQKEIQGAFKVKSEISSLD